MKRYKDMKYIVLSGKEVEDCPNEIKILPVGKVHSEKGDFVVDKESFQLMKAEMKRRGIDIVIDYEHQTLSNVQAPASGWIKELEYTPEAIVAKVEWTPKAKEYLKNREYRYLSPVIQVRKSDSKAAILHSLALTNTPAINGMFTIINSVDFDNKNDDAGGKEMNLQKIRELLGLPTDASEEQIMAALEKALAKKGKEPEENELVANKVILGLLELPENSKTEDVTSKIMSLKAGKTQKDKEMEDMMNRLKERDADDAVMLAMKAGKITAAQKDWAKEYALKDRKGFDSFVEKSPAVVPVGKLQLSDAPKKSMEVESFVLKATGMSKDDIEKYADKEDEES